MKKQAVPVVYGALIAGALIAYFLILAVFELHKYPIYSAFNIVITGVGMFLGLKKFRKEEGPKFKFQNGFMAAMTIGFIGTVIFTIFFAIYTSELNPGFSRELVTMWESDWFVNLGMLVFTVALMGLATTFVLSLAFMQLLKDSWNTAEGKKHTY